MTKFYQSIIIITFSFYSKLAFGAEPDSNGSYTSINSLPLELRSHLATYLEEGPLFKLLIADYSNKEKLTSMRNYFARSHKNGIELSDHSFVFLNEFLKNENIKAKPIRFVTPELGQIILGQDPLKFRFLALKSMDNQIDFNDSSEFSFSKLSSGIERTYELLASPMVIKSIYNNQNPSEKLVTILSEIQIASSIQSSTWSIINAHIRPKAIKKRLNYYSIQANIHEQVLGYLGTNSWDLLWELVQDELS